MKRLDEAWFEFAGARCGEMGLRLLKMPERKEALRKGESLEVPGRDGEVWIDGGAFEKVEAEVECESAQGYDEARVRRWLRGTGALVFSGEPDRAMMARADGCVFSAAVEGYDRRRVKMHFVCEPWRRHWPEAEAIVLTDGGVVENPGSAWSEPRLEIEAEGDFVLAVNGDLIEVKGGSVIIDSEMKDCIGPDGVSLANGRVALDRFPVLESGANVVSWVGDVRRVTILPRWRDI